MTTNTITETSDTVDLTDLAPENRACLEAIAAMRGLSVHETVAALIKEDTDRVLAAVAAGVANHHRHTTTQTIISGAIAARDGVEAEEVTIDTEKPEGSN